MKRNRQFAMVVALATLAWLPLAAQSSKIYRDGNGWVEEISGTLPAARTVRVHTEMGSIHLTGGSSNITYTVRKRVRTGSEEQARRELAAFRVAASTRGGAAVLEGDSDRRNFRNFSVDFQVNTPRELELAKAETDGGSVSVRSITARIETETGGGSVSLDDVSGAVSAETGGGSIGVANSSGSMNLQTGGGSISLTNTKSGKIRASSGGGSISVGNAQDAVIVDTGGGSIDIKQCGADVRASTGGGSIDVGDVAGRATIETGGGSIRLTSAKGPVTANTGGGSITLYKLMSGARAETGAGSITAEFLAANTDSLLQTSVGDVIVYIAPQAKLTIRATIDMANGHQIRAADFPGITISSEGGEYGPKSYSAQGAINGGGPVLRIHTMTGNVEIRRAK